MSGLTINILILLLYLSILVVTVVFHDRHSFWGKIIFKPILSLMFLGLSLRQTRLVPWLFMCLIFLWPGSSFSVPGVSIS